MRWPLALREEFSIPERRDVVTHPRNDCWFSNLLFRRRIIREKMLSDVESYMLEEHEMLRRSATELYCNMCVCEEVSTTLFGEH